MTTSRTSFNMIWLAEMPDRAGNITDAFNVLKRNIEEWIRYGHQVQTVSKNLFKLEGNNIVYFWYQTDDDIVLAAELDKREQGYVVNLVGKNPNYRNNPPYANDLYQDILEYIPYSLLFSDSQLSDDGINLWKKLVSEPDTILSFYNVKDPGHSFKELKEPADLDYSIGSGHRDDRFVLAKKKSIAETRSYFNVRRLRELSGLGLED